MHEVYLAKGALATTAIEGNTLTTRSPASRRRARRALRVAGPQTPVGIVSVGLLSNERGRVGRRRHEGSGLELLGLMDDPLERGGCICDALLAGQVAEVEEALRNLPDSTLAWMDAFAVSKVRGAPKLTRAVLDLDRGHGS